MAETQDYDKSAIPKPHATTHQDGGTDKIAVTGLLGLLGNAQTPLPHKTSHQYEGSDEISVAGLSGTLADDQHIIDTEVEIQILTRQKAKAYRAAPQTIPQSTWSKIEIDTSVFDPNSIVDLANHRIKPTRPGYYIVSATAAILLQGISTQIILAILKNTVQTSRPAWIIESGYIAAINGTDLIYFNGINDYVELYVYSSLEKTLYVDEGSNSNSISIVGPL